jgi:hypothetical protein
MSTGHIKIIMFLGRKVRRVHRADNLTARISRQCGILNISQPYRPPRPLMGIALLYFTTPCRTTAMFALTVLGNISPTEAQVMYTVTD